MTRFVGAIDQGTTSTRFLAFNRHGEVADMRGVMATKNDLADLRPEIHSLRADVASDMLTLEKRLSDRIVGLQRAVMGYHSSTVGHGLLYSELEERVRKIEQRLELPTADAPRA